MTGACKKHRWRPLRDQPTDTTDICPICQTERHKDADERTTYHYPPGYERKRGHGPIIFRITKDKPPGEAFVFCFEGQLHAQSAPIFGNSVVMCAAGPCECNGDPAKCRYHNPRLLHTIADHDHEKCLNTARQLVAEADSLPSVTRDANGNVTIVERMLIGEELVPHARQAVAAAEP
jgi:hypothetical protein